MPTRSPLDLTSHTQASATSLPWIQVAPGAPYFVTEHGEAWTPIGQNDAITWPDLAGLHRRQDLPAVERYLDMLAAHGVTVLRLMLEYSQVARGYFERPVGRFQPHMVRLWDDLFDLCEARGLRILMTPFDTYFMWVRWDRHPYNAKNGGPCHKRSQMLLDPTVRAAIKNRLRFIVERWGGRGGLFAWDLWNEIHPSYAGDSAECFHEFISDLSAFVRNLERERYGRTHPQTVSMFGPHTVLDERIPESIYRHPSLDFATTHLYEEGSIDHPRNTVDAAISFGRLVRECIQETPPLRPYFDSEHGPIHTHKDKKRTLPETFDDEYFRHMQWAHLASGGAGGGMRWPNRKPHCLTPGMRQAQKAMADFLPLIDWAQFRRRPLEVQVDQPGVAAFACGDDRQAVVFLLRTDITARDGTIRKEMQPTDVFLRVPGSALADGSVALWDVVAGQQSPHLAEVRAESDLIRVGPIPISACSALAVRPRLSI